MKETFADLKERLLFKHPLCFICKKRRATDLHHCFVHDSKRFHDLVTVEENLMEVCDIDHTSLEQTANSDEVKQAFAEEQKARGIDVGAWYRSLPMKIKEYWLQCL